MSQEDYNRFLQDKEDLRALKVGYKFLDWENKELKLKYRVDTDSLKREIEKLETENDKLKRKINEQKIINEKTEKRAEGYKNLAQQKSLEAARMKKWRGRYYAMASIKIGGVAIPIAGFIAGTFVIMKLIN